jgi:hypothetical protein
MNTLEIILNRMSAEPAFADAVFADAGKALAGYPLSAEELAGIKSMSRAQFNALAAEERKSFVITHNHNETSL